MPTFTWAPAPGAQMQQQPRVLKSPFGDGYVQRAGDGVNLAPQIWPLTFNRVDTEAADIVTFLRAQKGYLSFDWTSPDGDALVVVCEQWNKQKSQGGVSTITATFVQVFETADANSYVEDGYVE